MTQEIIFTKLNSVDVDNRGITTYNPLLFQNGSLTLAVHCRSDHEVSVTLGLLQDGYGRDTHPLLPDVKLTRDAALELINKLEQLIVAADDGYDAWVETQQERLHAGYASNPHG